MVPLRITLPASAAYEAGDTAQVMLDDAVVAPAIDLKPGGGDYAGDVFDTPPAGYGMHQLTVQVRDSVGNPSEGSAAFAFAATGPRPALDLRFLSQAGAGPIVFAFSGSPDL